MTTFNAVSLDGKLSLGSEYNSARFRKFLKDHPYARLKISPLLPESGQLRRFYFGALVTLIAFYQDNMDYRNGDDLEKIHEWLKLEFNAHVVEISGKKVKVAKSTKGELKSMIERVMDWMGEQGYAIDVLNPDEYKRFMDEIYSDGLYDNYISYLIDMGRLPSHEKLSTGIISSDSV